MPTAKARSAILLLGAALSASCDRAPPAPPQRSDAARPAAVRRTAADSACSLPLTHFAPSTLELVGDTLSPPINRLIIDGAGTMLWNAHKVEPRMLGDYLEVQHAIRPPVILVVSPAWHAPCQVVQEALTAAVRVGRCSPERCVFEWPGTDAPPGASKDRAPREPASRIAPSASPLPDRTRLLGNWVLVAIDDAAPPRSAPPIEVIFTDGAIGARSQCVTYHWLTSIEAGRLTMKVPAKAEPVCERMTSAWEDRFEAAMPSAVRIDSDGRTMIVTGSRGKLQLKRP